MRLIAHILMAFLLLCMAACNSGSTKSRVEGDTVYLPTGSSFGRIIQAIKEPNPPWKKFDGSYPALWPHGLKLPEDSHLIQSGSIHERETSMPDMFPNHRVLSAKGIAKGQPQAVYKELRGQIEDLGMPITSEQHSPANRIVPQVPETPPSFDLLVEGTPDGQILNLMLRVHEDDNLDGWVRYELSLVARSL